jgi:DNA-binding protein Fis
VDGEKVMIENALNACDNNKTAAAAMLGITRATIHSKIKHYDL